MSLQFEWDPNKATHNKRKHKVSFEEAMTVFADTFSATTSDPDHSEEEDRFIIIGYSDHHRVLIVSHTERGNRIRIISARELTPFERRQYEGKN